MLIAFAFWRCRKGSDCGYLVKGQIVTIANYADLLRQLQKKIFKSQLEKVALGGLVWFVGFYGISQPL